MQNSVDDGFMLIKCTQKEEGQDKLVDECINLYKNGTLKNGQRIIIFEDSKTFVWLNQEIKKTEKSIEEIKGLLISDYHYYLEKAWILELKKKYPVTINEKVLESLYKN
jgi:hypothetical protein